MLEQIAFQNIRNHQSFSADIAPNGLFITGSNGSGKTSILEAVFLIATTRSFRSRHMREVIQHGEDFGEIELKAETETLRMAYALKPRTQNRLSKNDVKLSTPEYLSKKDFFAVLFSPEEMQLPYASPTHRRRFLNRLLVPLFPSHYRSLRRFEEVLKNRNALLKRIADGLAQKNELDFYDLELAISSAEVTKQRGDFFANSEQSIQRHYARISGTTKELRVRFCPDTEAELAQKLKESYSIDLLRKSTTHGAHHDDFEFHLDGQSLESTGSRGEVRSAVLSLKLAEKEYIEKQTKNRPILLLDDVFSELDADRRRHLFEAVYGHQVLITATDVPSRAFTEFEIPLLTLENTT
jgi:DNA replication and repair protein RecF